MPFNTFSVATAVAPSVIETYFSHYLNRGPLKQKPTAHISYHEGLRLIRRFLDYSSQHSVEDLQGFTAQWVPAPTWVRIQDSEIAPQFLDRAARVLIDQLGRRGVDKIGGKTWWQWRRPESPLKAEWIEMKKDFNERKRTGVKCDRVILYVHGGAYYFGSVDEHRYQMQRHARKLKARVLAPRYRLAPQFPFPCGLYDCIATYFYLLEHFRPEQILIAGDSAGGGMVLSMLVTLRDQECPLPAGTILLSPWVDLTHSFPSVAGDGVGDYIPPHAFHHKPSMAWPPPPSDRKEKAKKYDPELSDAIELPVEMEASDASNSGEKDGKKAHAHKTVPGIGDNLSIVLDGKEIDLNEQIQMYAPNDLLAHPLVSPVMQPSLGGLPPMLIQVGGAELLQDEQIYLAHKAANPKAYRPSDAVLNQYDPKRETLNSFPPTDVQLQVWEDLCHVPHTLSFTRPAKYMYRSVAQFGAWALAHAQHRGIEIQDDDAISFISTGPELGEDADASSTDLRRSKTNALADKQNLESVGAVGKAGDPLPAFKDHMVRQRVTRHGVIYPLAPESEIACLALDPASIGAIKPGPVRKWLTKRRENDSRFANDRKKIQKKRAKEIATGYDDIPGETPPPTALVGRRRRGVAPEEKKKSKSWGLAMWSGWGSHHDESTLEREQKSESQQTADRTVQPLPGNAPPSRAGSNFNLAVPGRQNDRDPNKKRRISSVSVPAVPWAQRPRSPYRQVNDTGQAGFGDSSPQLGNASVHMPYSRRSSTSTGDYASRPVSVVVPTAAALAPDSEKVPGSQNTFLNPSNPGRPHNGVMAYPFRLRHPVSNPSITTLDSQAASIPSSVDPYSGPVEMPTPADEPNRKIEAVAEPVSAISVAPGSAFARETEPVSAVSATPSDRFAKDADHPLAATTFANAVPVEPRAVTPQSPDLDSVSLIESPQAPFAVHRPVFSNRSSMFGAIGADGMPITPLLAGVKSKENLSSPAAAQAALEGFSESDADKASPSVSPENSPKPAVPFKVRNPVFDSRALATNDQSGASPTIAQPPVLLQPPGEATEASKAAPFKLRHTVVEPKIAAHVRSQTLGSSSPAVSQTPTKPDRSEARRVADRAMTAVEPPSPTDLPPNSNVVMPTIVARRPTVARKDTPPKPPPKDEWRTRASSLSKEKASSDRKLGADRKQSPVGLPKSKFNTVPLLDELKFEKSGNGVLAFEKGGEGGLLVDPKSPGMQSFVTAPDTDFMRAPSMDA